MKADPKATLGNPNTTLDMVSTPRYNPLHDRRRKSRKRNVTTRQAQARRGAQEHSEHQAHINFSNYQWISTLYPTNGPFAWSNPYPAPDVTNAAQPSVTQLLDLETFASNHSGNEILGLGSFAWPYPQASEDMVYPGIQ